MPYLVLITIFISSLAWAEPVRVLQIGPLHEFFPFNQEPGKDSGCVVTMDKPAAVRVLSETADEFEVEWKVKPTGCLWQTLRGQSLKRGFVRKSDIYWDDDVKEELPMVNFKERMPQFAENPAECLDATAQSFIPTDARRLNVGDFIEFLRHEAGGIKPNDKIDLYQRCYPESRNGVANYLKYREFLPMAGEVFRLTDRREPQEVDPSLLSCLFRRESGFNASSREPTGAAGLGQHTNVNIADISARLRKPGSWESALWKKFFAAARENPRGRAMLASCMGSSTTGEPVFNTKDDAQCPLQSIAAGSIYILMIQRELSRQSKLYAVEWENQLEYLVAIAAAYNLGHGAGGQAVRDLLVKDWVGAIRRKSAQGKYGKDCEVMLHINAVRNCLQAENPWQPMHPSDKPVCEEFKGKKIDVLAKANTCDTGLNGPKKETTAASKLPIPTTTQIKASAPVKTSAAKPAPAAPASKQSALPKAPPAKSKK